MDRSSQNRWNSWSSTIANAKRKAWNVLKSSFTFHDSSSLSKSNVDSPEIRRSSAIDQRSPIDRRQDSSDVELDSMSTEAATPKRSVSCNLRSSIKKKENPRTVSIPAALCDRSTSKNFDSLSVIDLTESQRRALRCTWSRIRGNGGLQFTERVFEGAVQVAPEIKDIFYKAAFLSVFQHSRRSSRPFADCQTEMLGRPNITTCRDHARIILRLLDSLILGVDHSDSIWDSNNNLDKLSQYGAKHAFSARSAGMRPELWEIFGEVGVDIVRRYDCVRSNNEASQAWRILFASIIDEVRDGYERQLRKMLQNVV